MATKDILNALITDSPVAYEDLVQELEFIMRGDRTPAQIAGFLVGMQVRGLGVEEVRAVSDSMLLHAEPFDDSALPARFVDLVGTGGDQSNTVNITTMAALVVAGAGETVVKHGNRSASSATGTADVLENLGVNLELDHQSVADVAKEAGITLCFARSFHPALRHVAIVRSELAIPTVFNVTGPLSNPAQPPATATGVANKNLLDVVAGVFARRGKCALVFRGDDGLDEITVTAPSRVLSVRSGRVAEIALDPLVSFGIPRADANALEGGDATHNANVVRELLAGNIQGAIRDAVLLNAAAGFASLSLLDEHSGDDIVELLGQGLERARESLDGGNAERALARWVKASAAHTA